MVSEAELEARRRQAVQIILESGIVTPALDYDEAEVLLDWALARVSQYALSSRQMGDKEARSHIVHSVNRVRRLMEMVNDMVERWDEFGRVAMMEKLTQLLSAAMEDTDRPRPKNAKMGGTDDQVGDY
jgi:hypothetical protein